MVLGKALVAAWATCVCVAMVSANAFAATGDVVLYASDVTTINGNWARTADQSAAGGLMMASANNGWANTAGPLASPADFFEAAFAAPSATAYHVWIRLRASGNSKGNDGIYVQFSDAVDANGAALFRIGTTAGLVVNLSGRASGKDLAGWGWRDGAYWIVQQTTARFASSSTHTVRVQTREDGVQVDQIVLSPATYLTSAPGPAANDSTIVPKSISGTTPLPGTPTLPTPSTGATGVATSATLSWTAAGATTYDVKFGATNPPPSVANGLAAPSYTPTPMANGTTYYWQVAARNAAGSAAGPVWSFTTVTLPTPPPGPAPSPTAYNAVTDRTTYVKPALPQLGAAGYTFYDPTFGSRILRVTDGNTRPGTPNRSYRVPSNSHLATWNAASTGFYVISNDGTAIPYSFDAATMTARRLSATNSGDGGLTLRFYVEPHFSVNDPNLIYGASGNNNRTIMQYDFAAGTYSTVLDLDTVVGGLAGTYVGGVMTTGTPETLMAFFGGASQDAHFYLLFAPLGNLSARRLVNTVSSTINGRSTNITLNFHLHSAAVDRSGRYVFLYPTSVDLAAPRSAAQVYLWDTATDQITALPVAALSGGHDAYGFGYSVNQDCCTSSTWDAMQWQFRYLSNPVVTSDLISPVLTPKEIYIDDHTSWNNARPDALVPVISSTYRYYGSNNTTPWRAWDDEIIAIDTTGGIGGVTYRFAHHRSDSRSDTDPTSTYFWYQPIASVSPDGRFVIFTSNWEKTLGTDASEGTFRQDVFLVQLTPR
jgi:hypothetical protein